MIGISQEFFSASNPLQVEPREHDQNSCSLGWTLTPPPLPPPQLCSNGKEREATYL